MLHGKTQTDLLSYRSEQESWNCGFSKYTHRTYTIQAADSKGAVNSHLTNIVLKIFNILAIKCVAIVLKTHN